MDEVLRGSGRCVSPMGGGGGWGEVGGVDGRLLEGGSPLGGGEKAVCLADKIHGRAELNARHHLLQCCQ